MLSRQRRAEVVVARDRFIDRAIDASFQDVPLSDRGWAKKLRTLTDSLYQDVFGLVQSTEEDFGSNEEKDQLTQETTFETKEPVYQLTQFATKLTNAAQQHPLFKQITVIRFLRSLNKEWDIPSLFNRGRENELNSLIASAKKNVIRCEKEANKEVEKNQRLEGKRAKNPQLVREKQNVAEEYQQILVDSRGDIRGDDPTPEQTKAYKEAVVFLEGSRTKQNAHIAARNELTHYQRQIAMLEDQKKSLADLPNITEISAAAKDFVKKYPTAIELVTVEQFLFCLMADVLVTLNTFRKLHQTSLEESCVNIKQFYKDQNLLSLVINIDRQINKLTHGGYLPKAPEVHDLFKIQNEADLFQFMSDIGSHKRLQYKLPTAVERPRYNSAESRPDDTAGQPSVDSSPLLLRVTEESVPAAAPYFPVYLAKSFMLHFANSMENYASGLNDGIMSNHKPIKGILLDEAAKLLRNNTAGEMTMTSFKDIYAQIPRQQINSLNWTIADILNTRRDLNRMGQPSDAFATTLTQAGDAFLRENPASLMRRHAFLEWLQETCTLPESVDSNIAQGHLIEVVAQIKALRAVMKLLYPASSAPVATSTILKCVSELVAFGKKNEEKNAEIAILVRLLLLAGVDKLDSANFAKLKAADKSWLLDSAEIITDKQGYLKAVAKNITATPKVIEYGIGCWVTALLEITSFQQARYESLFDPQPYTHQEHQEKIEPIVLHLSQCVESYFEESALKPKAEMPQPAQVAKVFSTSQGVSEPIELTVRSCASGDRLRLPVNLQSDIQAMLTWGVTGYNPVHLRTLALLNSSNADALHQWRAALASSDSHAAWMNAAMLRQALNSTGNAFAKIQPLECAEKIKHYTALVALAETLLQHLKGLQSEPEMPENADLAQFYKAVNDNMNRLMEVIVQEKNDAPSDVQQELEALAGRAQAFSAGLIRVCYVVGANNVIGSIRDIVFGNKIIDPKNPAFDEAFKKFANVDEAPSEEKDQYFIDVMFTLAHHPIAESDTQVPKSLCTNIKDYFENPHQNEEKSQPNQQADTDQRALAWRSLYESFYGNSAGLQQLIDYYFSVILNDVAIKKALKIAIFGFAYPDFEAGKLMFAQQILRAFAALAQLGDYNTPGKIMDECHDSIVYLKQAFALLATTPHEIVAEERGALEALEVLATELGGETKNHSNALIIAGLKHEKVREYLEDRVASSLNQVGRRAPMLSIRIQKNKNAVIDIAMKVGGATDDDNLLTLEDISELGNFIDKITNICFKPQLRYYRQLAADGGAITQLNKKDNKLTDTKNRGREELKQRCRDKVAALLKAGDLTSEMLKKAMNQLRDEVLEGGVETEREALQPIPHAMEPLVDKDFGAFQSDDRLLAAFKNRINEILARANYSSLVSHAALAASNVAPAEEFDDLLPTNEAADHAVEEDDHAVNSAAVLAATEWFDADEDPRADVIAYTYSGTVPGNALIPFRGCFDVSVIDQHSLDQFMPGYRELNERYWFEIRVGLIRAGKSPRALEHVVNNVRQSLEDYGSAAELDAFIDQLKLKIEERPAAEYQRYLKDFVWAVAETVAFHSKGKQALFINSATSTEIAIRDLLQPVIDHGFDQVALIALGCEQYAMMSEDARIQKGSRLLEALLYIVSQSGLFTNQRQNVLPAACQSLIEKLRTALTRKNTAPKSPNHDDGTAIYYLIYTLAQAMSYEEDSAIKTRYEFGETADINDSRMEDRDYTNDVDDSQIFAAPVEDSVAPNNSDARKLLDRLNALLFSNTTFSAWHRKIAKIGSGYESSLHVLTFHEEYSVAEMRGLLAKPSHSDSIAVTDRIAKMKYFWEKSYEGNDDLQTQLEYEALAIDELVRIFNADKITEVTFENFNAKGGKYKNQCNGILEQLALVFLAAKRWYKTEQDEDARTPFIPALSLLASGVVGSGKQDPDFESMMKSLLEKACDSFNAMLQSKNQEKSASQTAEYVLLTKEVIQWLKDTPEILTVYVARTLETGVHCKEQAELIFQLLSQASETPTIEFIPQNSQNDRRVSTVGLELPSLFSSVTSFISKTGTKTGYESLPTEDENEDPVLMSSNVIIDARPNLSRSDDELQLLSKAFECMYQYIDQGIPKKTRLKLSSGTVETRLREFLAQVEKHHLWQDYWNYVEELEQSNSVKNYDVGNRLSEKGKPYLKLYTDLLWNCWLANPYKGQEEEQKEVWLNVVMGHLFGNYVAIEDAPGAILIVRQMIVDVDLNLNDDIQYVADNHRARGLTALAQCLVTIKLNQPLDKSSKKDRALAVIQFVTDEMLPVFLNVNPSQEDSKIFIYHGLLKPLQKFLDCKTEKFYRPVGDALRAFCGKLDIKLQQPPAQISGDAAGLPGQRRSGMSDQSSVPDVSGVLEEDGYPVNNNSLSRASTPVIAAFFHNNNSTDANEETKDRDNEQASLLGQRTAFKRK